MTPHDLCEQIRGYLAHDSPCGERRMGERGHSLHVLGENGREALSASGHGVAILARNARWTSFVPLQTKGFDDAELSRALGLSLLHVWFDDDLGVILQAYDSGTYLGELALPHDDDSLIAKDLDLIATLEDVGLITKLERAAILKRIDDFPTLRSWALDHGLERLLGLPSFVPMPPGLPKERLVPLLPEAAVILAAKPASKRRRLPSGAASGPERAWSAAERKTLALHFTYWSEVWTMKNLELFDRYKKHLPLEHRREVDRLGDAVARGDVARIRSQVESILSRVWECEDWDEVIRDPMLADGDPEEWEKWRARLERAH